METVIKKLSGFSGSEILLMQGSKYKFVRKIKNVQRNYERLSTISSIVPVPIIYTYDGEILDMQYIHGYDMKWYLTNYNTRNLSNFIIKSLNNFAISAVSKDYTETYHKMLFWLDNSSNEFPFTKQQLIQKLPKILPCSQYHGDMTLENILYTVDNKFYFIDAVTLPYDSYVFDIAKLRQDLDCKWFLRKESLLIDPKLSDIKNQVLKYFPNTDNDYLLILMLLRVYLYCEKNSLEYNLIMKEVWRLWK